MALRNLIAKTLLLGVIVLIAFTPSDNAVATVFNSTYEASSGVFPEQVCPPWSLFDTAQPEAPFLSGEKLIIGTSDISEILGYEQLGPDLVIPNPLIVEARLKFVSGSSVHPARAPVLVHTVVSPAVGNGLYIGRDDIFILSSDLIRGQSASVDTDDAFHTYRIEISSGVVKVFYDGVLTLTGSTFFSIPNFGNNLNIFWGEGSILAQGTSEWEFVRHNASSVTCETEVTIDIKPGGFPNSVNCENPNENIPVAILTTENFDATNIDHTTVTFEGASEIHVNQETGEPRRHEEDVDGDGDLDLVFHFHLIDTNLTCNSNEGTLIGETFDGQAIRGTDSVRMIP